MPARHGASERPETTAPTAVPVMSRSGLAESFNLDNYRASSNTNGTQTRRDVNRAYTQPSLPTIGNRGM